MSKTNSSKTSSTRWLGLALLLVTGFVVMAWLSIRWLSQMVPEPVTQKPEVRQPTQRTAIVQPRPIAPILRKVPTEQIADAGPPEPRWVGKKPNLPPHEELMRRVRSKYELNPNAKPIPKPGSDHFALDRKKFADMVNVPIAQSGALFKPEFMGNRPEGIRVTDVKPGSLYDRLGLSKDDVLMSVNGRNVYSPGHAYKYYRKIAKRSRNLTLRFRRGRKVHTIDFSLRSAKNAPPPKPPSKTPPSP